jgi:hypothetical protein
MRRTAKGLTYEIVSGAVKVLGGKGSLIYHGKGWVDLAKDMPLD